MKKTEKSPDRELAATLNAMLELLKWHEQLVHSGLKQLKRLVACGLKPPEKKTARRKTSRG